MPTPPPHHPQFPSQHPLPPPTIHVPNSRFPALIYRSAIPLPPLPLKSPSSSGGATDEASVSTDKALVSADEALAQQTIEPNGWAYGGTFKTYWACHFHSVTHECYVVVRGGSLLRLGRGPLDGLSSGEGRGGDAGGENGGGRRYGDADAVDLRWNPSVAEREVRDGDIWVWVARGDAIVLPAGVSHCSVAATRDYEYLGFYPEVCEPLGLLSHLRPFWVIWRLPSSGRVSYLRDANLLDSI